jgi:hypothetical protein
MFNLWCVLRNKRCTRRRYIAPTGGASPLNVGARHGKTSRSREAKAVHHSSAGSAPEMKCCAGARAVDSDAASALPCADAGDSSSTR